MTASIEQIEAHRTAYVVWKAAETGYWAMCDDLARGIPIDSARREEVLRVFDETHKAWMRSSEPLTGFKR